ncbi:MAG TPA: SIP domain-containing protein, partial [Rhizomicrobium sp.]
VLKVLAPGAPACALLKIAAAADRQDFAGSARLAWLTRDGAPAGPGRLLYDAVETFALPPGRGHAYVLGETSNVRAIRQRLLARGLGKTEICAEGYWRPGRIGGHDHV